MKNILIILFALVSITANAQTYLIKIGALKGDSQISGFLGNDGWSAIYSYNLDISSNLQFNYSGFEPVVGKAECGMIEITKKYYYQVSNELSSALHKGTKYAKVEIVGLKNDPFGMGLVEFVRYTFTEVMISKFNKSVASGGDAQLQENIGFKAESFLIDHTTFHPTTGAPTKLTFGWNFKTNLPL